MSMKWGRLLFISVIFSFMVLGKTHAFRVTPTPTSRCFVKIINNIVNPMALNLNYDDGGHEFYVISDLNSNHNVRYVNFDDEEYCSQSLYLEASYVWSGAVVLSGHYRAGETALIGK